MSAPIYRKTWDFQFKSELKKLLYNIFRFKTKTKAHFRPSGEEAADMATVRPRTGTPPSKWDMQVLQIEKDKGKGKVQAVVHYEGNTAPDDTEVSFTLFGTTVIKTTKAGKAEHEFRMPKGILTGKIVAQVLKGNTRPIEVTVEVEPEAAKPSVEGGELHRHVLLPNPLDRGRVILALSIQNEEGKFMAAKIQISFGGDVVLDGTHVPAGEVKTKDVPDSGLRLNLVFLVRSLPVEIFVEGLKKRYDFTIYGRRPMAPIATAGSGVTANLISGWEGMNPSLRLWSSWLPIAALIAVWDGAIVAPVVIALVLFGVAAVYFWFRGEAHARTWNPRLAKLMGTNNQWSGVWGYTTLLALLTALFLMLGGPTAPAPLTSGPLTPSEQRVQNAKTYGKALTDRQVEVRRKLGLLTGTPPPTEAGRINRSVNWLERAVLPDRSGDGWFVRFFVLALLLIGTGAYTLVAYHDERQELAEKRHERSGGQKSWFDWALGMLGHKSKNPPRRSGNAQAHESGSGWYSWVIKLLAISEVIDLGNLVSRIFKKYRS
jgi:hypothetical protein